MNAALPAGVNEKDVQLFSIAQDRAKVNRVAPDTELAGYPANLFYRISGIRPDIRYPAGYPAELLKGVTKKNNRLTFSQTFTVFKIL